LIDIYEEEGEKHKAKCHRQFNSIPKLNLKVEVKSAASL
jgi:hypothetical protein